MSWHTESGVLSHVKEFSVENRLKLFTEEINNKEIFFKEIELKYMNRIKERVNILIVKND